MVEKTCSGRTRTYERPITNEFNKVKVIKMKGACKLLSDEELLEHERKKIKREYPHLSDYRVEELAQRNFSFRQEMVELRKKELI